jgi:Protein of unknown function (DUF2892)
MHLNLGTFDRILRIVIGIALVALAFWWLPTPWGWQGIALMVVGLILIATALVSWCPIYSVLGLGTRESVAK